MSSPKLVCPPHFTSIFCCPVHMSLKHIQTVGLSDVWNREQRKVDVLALPIFIFRRLAVQHLSVLTSRYDDLPVCAIRLHGLNDVFFGVTPVDPISIQIIHSQPSRPAQVLLPHKHLSVLTVHPRWLYSGFPAPVCPIHHPADTEIITETKWYSWWTNRKVHYTCVYIYYSLIPQWWIDNDSSRLVEVCVDQPLPVPSI